MVQQSNPYLFESTAAGGQQQIGGVNRANTASVPPHLPGFGPTGWSPPPSPLTGRVGTPTTLHTVMTTGYGAAMVPPHRVTTAAGPHSYATGRAGPLFPSGTPAPQRANSAMAQLLCQVSLPASIVFSCHKCCVFYLCSKSNPFSNKGLMN